MCDRVSEVRNFIVCNTYCDGNPNRFLPTCNSTNRKYVSNKGLFYMQGTLLRTGVPET